ncbi:hypothetical protein J4573_17800 [Actinomadura barringtoniae]|uniref:Uncharacterized protein n=1 Tax=Actinomadura barringtoniae TaxID=1427535 RepID=A0A939PA32_9ACTN|nr:hypothetical protein [Actinomadura barringtoniae]MBO2448962.1 hypothetical protein [Actinomadura barringtoniae]
MKRVVQAGTVVAVLAIGITPAVNAEASVPHWKLAKTYKSSVKNGYASATAVEAFGGKDAWAFSADLYEGKRLPKPRAEHWNGKTWRGVALPKGLWGGVFSVQRSSPTNVWAVGGSDLKGNNGPGSYAMRWNGKKWAVAKKWKDGVSSVTVISPTNVWVFGVGGADTGAGTWHFNGKTWTRVRPFGNNELASASAASARLMWATGREGLLARYNGSKWSRVSLGKLLPPAIPHHEGKPSRTIDFSAVRAFSASQVWVTGRISDDDGKDHYKTTSFLLNWNGKAWRRVGVPANWLIGWRKIDSDGAGGLWIDGWAGREGRGGSLIQHRSRSGKWTAAPLRVAGRTASIRQFSHIPGTKSLWAVGEVRPTNNSWSTGALWRLYA